ncbi:enoyl-CoA hydratase [Alkalispirochaeta odontotermitis]|nr:enoyl-CoA hydratase [Alkalispirochaeta odontotermitis]CAB1083227.1 Enoyl-CoA hydratase/isomerase [Olavius algarvensis Delta 1 endosymbiont]
MSESDQFKVEHEDHIAWLILNRPAKRNVMGAEFFEELSAHLAQLDQDPAVRAVVIKAEGKSFTAGTDLNEAASLLSGKGADQRENTRIKILALQAGLTAIEKCRKPVIAAVHSHCIGGGVDLISACDIRLATEDAVFSIRETRMGIIADLGTLQRLPYIIGQGWFRELALTGRDFTAAEALQMGLLTRVCEDREALYAAAKELATQIADCPPLTVQGVKDVILYSRDHGIDSGLEYVAQKNTAALPSEDVVEAVTAFMEKRKPKFIGR